MSEKAVAHFARVLLVSGATNIASGGGSTSGWLGSLYWWRTRPCKRLSALARAQQPQVLDERLGPGAAHHLLGGEHRGLQQRVDGLLAHPGLGLAQSPVGEQVGAALAGQGFQRGGGEARGDRPGVLAGE
ncbi:hypothetical protein QFZ68_007519 [Streptomyces sp. V1I6]|nr:hypothetical protein [Streptomyces sp. V1I6]